MAWGQIISTVLDVGQSWYKNAQAQKAAKAADAKADGSAASSGLANYYQQQADSSANRPYQQLGYSAVPLYNWLATGKKPVVDFNKNDAEELQALEAQEDALKAQYGNWSSYSGSNKKVYALARLNMEAAQNKLNRLNELRQRQTQARAVEGVTNPLEAYGYKEGWTQPYQQQSDSFFTGMEDRNKAIGLGNSAYEQEMRGLYRQARDTELQDSWERAQAMKALKRQQAATGNMRDGVGLDRAVDLELRMNERLANDARDRLSQYAQNIGGLGKDMYGRNLDSYNASYGLGMDRLNRNYGLQADDFNRQQTIRTTALNNLGNLINVGQGALPNPYMVQPTAHYDSGAAAGIVRSQAGEGLGGSIGNLIGSLFSGSTNKEATLGQYNPSYNGGLTPQQWASGMRA